MDRPAPQVLLIDDEPHLLLGLKAILERGGYRTLCANNGLNGIEIAKQKHPDLIICDLMMPPPSGLDVREELAKNPQTRAIPFVYLTARIDKDDRLRGVTGGADDYITKPFDRHELLARIGAIIRRDTLSREQAVIEKEAEIERVRREISHNLGHELRTPLTVLLWTLELALHEKFADKPKEVSGFISQALSSAHQLHSIIEDMIILNEIDKEEVAVSRTDINIPTMFVQPIKECLDRWKSQELQISFHIDPLTSIHAPPQAFKRAVIHLVDNAFKFSPKGGQVNILLEPWGRGGCTLTVSDQGPGIAPELREKVFERFFQQSQGLSRKYGGLGVGLSVARAIARRLGGDVVILDSSEGCRITLSIAPSSTPETRADQGE